jgi:predicted PurR-regulated permease PerM
MFCCRSRSPSLLSFVLTPLLLLLRKIKVPRVFAVAIVVTFAFAIIFALGWMLSQQASQLAGELPRYQHVLAQKIAALRKSAESSSTFEKAAGALKGLEDEIAQYAGPPPESSVSMTSLEGNASAKPIPVEIRKPEPRAFEILQSVLGTVLPPLATAGIVILFVILILLQRGDLRDRLVWSIGVPSPIVWGVLAMLMRFVPDMGSFIAAAPAGAAGRRRRPGLDDDAFDRWAVSRLRADDGSSGRAARLWSRYRPVVDRRHPLHRVLDLAVGTARPPARHAALRVPRGARAPCPRD